jgi:hypothetical protein
MDGAGDLRNRTGEERKGIGMRLMGLPNTTQAGREAEESYDCERAKVEQRDCGAARVDEAILRNAQRGQKWAAGQVGVMAAVGHQLRL